VVLVLIRLGAASTVRLRLPVTALGGCDEEPPEEASVLRETAVNFKGEQGALATVSKTLPCLLYQPASCFAETVPGEMGADLLPRGEGPPGQFRVDEFLQL